MKFEAPQVCDSPDLSVVSEALSKAGVTAADCVRMVEQVTETPASSNPVIALRRRLEASQVSLEEEALERTLLLHTAAVYAPRIELCAVPESVKHRLHGELLSFRRNRAHQKLIAGTSAFVSAAKFATLRRFPAGPLDWETGGLPRSWIWRAGTDGPRLLTFMLTRVGGFRPLFFTHVARQPFNRSLILEKEVMHTYHRIACAVRLQPQIKGIMTASWFHQPQILAERPHLEPLNRVYLQAGGLIVGKRESATPGHPSTMREGIAVWPRKAVLSWADAHLEFGESLETGQERNSGSADTAYP